MGDHETMNNRLQPSEGVFIYVLGLVVLATRPGRFWLGFALALAPIAVGTVVKLIEALKPDPRRRA
jgi:hypothetical protein